MGLRLGALGDVIRRLAVSLGRLRGGGTKMLCLLESLW